MYTRISLRESLDDLRRNKVRTFLTSLGILIGVFSVVLLISFGLGLKNVIQEQFENLGGNLVIVIPGNFVSDGQISSPRAAFGGARFDDKDVVKVGRIGGVEKVAPIFLKTVTVSSSKDEKTVELFASTEELFSVLNTKVEFGKQFTKSDVSRKAKSLVIGPTLAEDLFGSVRLALNKTVRIENQAYKVVGISEEKGGGGFGGPDFDNVVFVPHTAVISLNPDKTFFELALQVDKEDRIPQVKKEVELLLLRRYDDDDFSVVDQKEILGIFDSIFATLNMILMAIGSISLLVGGIGIMNIMYAAVTERIKEIGIRRALGATKADILFQFLSQAVLLSLFGGILGLSLAIGIVLVIQSQFPAEVSLVAIISSLTVSTAIGIIFGVFPALKAANLSPIEAIRYE